MPGGYFRLDIGTFKEIPSDKGVIDDEMKYARRVQASAASIASEVYTISTRRGVFRTYIRVAGEEPGTEGYKRGILNRALWSSTTGWPTAKSR